MTKETWHYEKISSVHIKLLRGLGILPFEGRTLNFIGTRLLCFYCHLMSTFYNTMYLGYGVRMIANNKFEVDYMCEVVMVQGMSFRYLIIYLKRNEFTRLIESCKELWQHLTTEEGRTVREFEKKAYYYRTFVLWNSVVVVTLFIITAQFVRLPPVAVNGTARRILPFRFYVDVQEEPTFTLVSAFQGLVCYSIAVILPGIETVGLYLIMMACGYLRSIQNRLLVMTEFQRQSNLDRDKLADGKNTTDQLIFTSVLDCAKFHQKIMKFCEEIEHFMRSLFMTTILCSVYNLSLIGIKLLENDEYFYKYISLLVLNLTQLFICQWSPEHLLNESEAIGNAAYFATLEHPKYEAKANRILFLMMIRAQRPIQLTAGGYINLSIETFGSMVTSAFSFFTVVRSFNT